MGWLGAGWGKQERGEVGGLKFLLLFPFTLSLYPFPLAPTSWCFYYLQIIYHAMWPNFSLFLFVHNTVRIPLPAPLLPSYIEFHLICL